jgi:DNA-binding MurR/RpiR family transcriptional regulator
MINARELTTDQMKVLRWLSSPENEREPKTLEDLATEIGVRPATILKWRSRKLDALAAEEIRMQLFEHLPEVYDVLAREATDGSPEHMKLFLTVACGHDVPPTAPTAPDGPTALMWTEGNAKMNKGDNDV